MSRIAQPPPSAGDQADLTPLIDVIFLLLLFFIITTTFAEDAFFTTTVPRAQAVRELRTLGNSAMVDIVLEGQQTVFQVHTEAVAPRPITDREQLTQTLGDLRRERGVKAVIIRIQERRPTQYLVWALDAVKAASIPEYSLTTRE